HQLTINLMEVLAVFVLVTLFMVLYVVASAEDGKRTIACMVTTALYIFGVWVRASLERDRPVVIKKSSDTEWEIHTGEPKIYQDTTITRVVVINGDTLLPTTEYRVLWRDGK